MSDPTNPLHLSLRDVAREAGVSTATVDRVLHDRPGVRKETIRRVRETIERIGFHPNAAAAELARGQSHHFCFVLPRNLNFFMTELMENIEKMRSSLGARRVRTEIVKTDVFDPDALVETLDGLAGRCDGVAVVALDHPKVRDAIDRLVAQDTIVVTLVSDAPTSRRTRYVGIDNVAAGRTSGTLLGRFVGRRTEGKVAVVVGSLSLRDHVERLFGISQVISGDFPKLQMLPAVEGRDNDDLNYELTRKLLAEHPDLVGLYNIGAGTAGIGNALSESGRASEVVFVAHDVTPQTRRFLEDGVVDAVISQNPGHEARSAIRVLMALRRNESIIAEQEQIGVDIVIKDNLPIG
ncbi:LacI family DNA-binding transcriptional regulator [Oryzibacter oryziterrae]|uniref:LacI family DNA-binding transcriptional regulator n=1 Tax=Oryzibacter oryziterrae TaxID=2766474 RepID=UPI001F2EDA4F|nr:LacI family DNA-binding transcriptional regulator [Oryzibacter oryziterrae]